MITIKLFDQYNNLLYKDQKADINDRVEVNFSVYSTAHHYLLTDEEDNTIKEGQVIPVIVL